MAWTSPRTWVPGEFVTALMMNTHIRDNLGELRAGGLSLASQAAGDLLYATSATQLARRAIGTEGQALVVASGVPVWGAASGGIATYAATLVNVSNTVTKTTWLSFTIPAGAMADGDRIEIWCSNKRKQNTGSASTAVFSIDVAGTETTWMSLAPDNYATEAVVAMVVELIRAGTTLYVTVAPWGSSPIPWLAFNGGYSFSSTMNDVLSLGTPTFTNSLAIAFKLTLGAASTSFYFTPNSAAVTHFKN